MYATRFALAASALVSLAGLASAQPIQLRVTIQNLSPTNSISFAPLRVGFNNGTYDSFNTGQAAGAPIVSIAEGGSGSDWFPAFAAADPTATLGTVVGTPAGPLFPGITASTVFTVDPSVNRYFTFAAMIVPSNDYFIGNDSPTQYMLFNALGQLNITSISQFGRDVWDAGSEQTIAANAAFLIGGNNADRVAQNGVVESDFLGLSAFDGLTTAAGYVFNRQFGANDEIYRITFEVVPTPAAAGLLGLGGLLAVRRRRATA